MSKGTVCKLAVSHGSPWQSEWYMFGYVDCVEAVPCNINNDTTSLWECGKCWQCDTTHLHISQRPLQSVVSIPKSLCSSVHSWLWGFSRSPGRCWLTGTTGWWRGVTWPASRGRGVTTRCRSCLSLRTRWGAGPVLSVSGPSNTTSSPFISSY